MGIFGNLFGSKKLHTTDSEFGEIESFSTNGDRVGWQIELEFLGFEIEVLIEGDKDGISESQKNLLINALANESQIKSESENALREQFENADMEFRSIEEHFALRGISVREDGFEVAFQELGGRNYFFNIHFEDNKAVGVSIDG